MQDDAGQGQGTARPTVYVMVGLPASGKTTRARQLETEHRALRLTPDEWMIPLFGEPEADRKRDVLEGRLLWLALRAVRAGICVVLDFGVWSKDERSAIRWLVTRAGADCDLVFLPVGVAEQQRRMAARFAASPTSTFRMTPGDLETYSRVFQVPDDAELAATHLEPPPAGCATWGDWAAQRWPTSTS